MRPRFGGGGPRQGGGGPPRRGFGGRPRRQGPPDDPKTALSKILSYALRHKPEEFGLSTDHFGFVPINELMAALHERPRWADLGEEQIMEIVDGAEKKRFQVRDGLIRARYGHSFDVMPPDEPVEPPEVLYHGTPRQAIPKIMEDGLKSMRRQFVHLSASEKAAREVGMRRDTNPVILEVQAKKAHDEGVKFYQATEEIYLVENVPPPFCNAPE